MTNAADGKRDFFVSYNKADLPWAEWVGSTLRANGFSVLLSEWDAKGNLVTFMEEAHRRTERTVALLSDNYHGSDFTTGEWTARPLLELLAFFAPDALPVAVLSAAPAALPDGLTDELERDDAISPRSTASH